jgi:hypothetical protein
MIAILPEEKIAKINSDILTKHSGSMSPFVGDNASNDLMKAIKSDNDLSHLYLRGLITIICESDYYMPRIELV